MKQTFLHSGKYLTSKGRTKLTTMIRPDLRSLLDREAKKRFLSMSDILEEIIEAFFYKDGSEKPVNDWLTVEEMSDLVGVSVSTIRRLLPEMENNAPEAAFIREPKRGRIFVSAKYAMGFFNAEKTIELPNKDSGEVYLMRDRSSGFFKIGYSKNSENRLKSFKTGNATIDLIEVFPGTYQDESALHNIFKYKRKQGEWFSLDWSDIDKIKDYFNNKLNQGTLFS